MLACVSFARSGQHCDQMSQRSNLYIAMPIELSGRLNMWLICWSVALAGVGQLFFCLLGFCLFFRILSESSHKRGWFVGQ